MHHAALEFDIGIYFEANGHGTVLFGPNYYKWMDTLLETEDKLWFQTLSQLINPAVGDALSDLLLVDLLLQKLQWNLQDWNTLYQDWPSRQLKVKVQDRSLVQCNANETKCIAPSSLQPALEQLMASTEKGRCFVRASGTENVVRVYAEAASRPLADQLATQTAQLVHRHCGGVGPLSAI